MENVYYDNEIYANIKIFFYSIRKKELWKFFSQTNDSYPEDISELSHRSLKLSLSSNSIQFSPVIGLIMLEFPSRVFKNGLDIFSLRQDRVSKQVLGKRNKSAQSKNKRRLTKPAHACSLIVEQIEQECMLKPCIEFMYNIRLSDMCSNMGCFR